MGERAITLADEIVGKELQHIEGMRRIFPCHTNRASALGHPCVRYLTYMRTAWKEQRPPSVGLQRIFEEGKKQERLITMTLCDLGFEIEQAQKDLDWPEYQITGHIDGKVRRGNSICPVEIKSVSPFAFDKIKTIDGMKRSDWHQRWFAQLQIYLLMGNESDGLFILKNKSNGQLAVLPVDLDLEVAEGLIRKAETVNKHVAAGTLPDPIEYSESTCGDCPFRHICLPDMAVKDALSIEIDPELEEKLARWYELKQQKAEFDALDKELKTRFDHVNNVIVGDFLVRGKEIKTTRYDVPADIKKPYAKESSYWRRDIVALGVDSSPSDEG